MNKTIVIQSTQYEGNTDSNDQNSSDDLIDISDVDERVITIRYEGVALERLKIMLRESNISHIVEMNELQSSVMHIWSDLSHTGDVNDMERFQKFTVECESGFSIDQVMEVRTEGAFKAMMASLYEDMGYEFYRFFRKLVIPTCPSYLVELGLTRMYEQVVFHEYIYSSSIYSLFDKIRWIIDNGYTQLIDLLDDHYIEVWNKNMDPTSPEDYTALGFEYRLMGNNPEYMDRFFQLRDMIDLHSPIMLNETHLENENENSGLSQYISLVMRCRNAESKDRFVSLERLTIRKIQKLVGKVSRDSDAKSRLDIYTDYVLTDFLLDMVQRGFASMLGWNEVTQGDIIYRWLVYASRIINSSNCRYSVISRSDLTDSFVSHYLYLRYTSDINLEYISRDGILKYVNIDFASMIYIIMKDNLEMFSAITRNCGFDIIDPIILAYYPESIINHISIKTGRSIKNIMTSVRADIEIDLHILSHNPHRADKLQDIVFRYAFGKKNRKRINIQDIVSGRVDQMNEDIITLHELEEIDEYICESRINGEKYSIETILNSIFYENSYLDEAKMYFDRLGNISIFGILSYVYMQAQDYASPLGNYITYLITNPSFDRIAPDLNEVCDSLLFLKNHRDYVGGLRVFVEMRTKFLTEKDDMDDDYYGVSSIDMDTITLQTSCTDPDRYGVYNENNQNCDESDELNSDLESETSDSKYDYMDSASYQTSESSDSDDSW